MSGLSEEIDIDLTLDEVIRLENEKILGSLKVRAEGNIEKLPARKIELEVNEFPVDSRNLYINSEAFPKGASFETITEYHLFISLEGYTLLKEKRKLVDRPSNNSKVTITCRNSDNLPTYLSE